MKHYLVGRGIDGKSTITAVREINIDATEGGTSIDRFAYLPPATFAEPLPREVPDSVLHPVDIEDGGLRWTIFRQAPNYVSQMHHTDTYDFNIVLSGETTAVLADGRAALRPGDSILMTGLEHEWHAGPEGCVMASVLRGVRRES